MKKINLLICAMTLTMATSCSIFKGNKSVKEPEPVETGNDNAEKTTVNASNIAGEWNVFSVGGKKVTGEERPYINFNLEDHRIYGSNGCNIINGDFTAKDDSSLKIENMITTMMACPDAPFENDINLALDKARYFSISRQGHEYYLVLLDESRKSLMTLRHHNMDFLNGSWKIEEINGHDNDNDEVRMVIDISEQRVHGNTGCNILNGALMIDPDKSNSIQFSNLATTRMMCPDMATETAFLVALESVEYAKKGKNNTVIMTDKNNRPMLRLKRIDVK